MLVNNINNMQKITRQTKSSLNRVTFCANALQSELKDGQCHPIITANSKTSPLLTLLQTTKASNLRTEMKWVVKFLIRCCSQLQLDPARVNQEWLEHSDLSPLAKDWTIWVFVLFVASLAAFHLSLKSIRTLGQQRGKKSERKWNGRAQTSKGRSLSYLS